MNSKTLDLRALVLRERLEVVKEMVLYMDGDQGKNPNTDSQTDSDLCSR